MKLDCLLIHAPKFNDFCRLIGNYMNIMYMPMGVFAIADYLQRKGRRTQIMHLGVEHIKNPEFSLREYIKQANPRIVGLDLHWNHQSYDVIRAAEEIKSTNPDIFVVLGGFTASYFHDGIMNNFGCIDAVIRGDGEVPFLRLTEEVAKGNTDFSEIPNLTWRQKDGLKANKISYIATTQDLDSLDFTNIRLLKNYETYVRCAKIPWFWMRQLNESLNLRLFTFRQKVFPLATSRGCSVNCSYCGGSRLSQEIINARSGVTLRSIDKVIESIIEAKQYGFESFIIEYLSLKDSCYYEELFARIKKEGIQTDCVLSCSPLPSRNIIRMFKEAFGKRSLIYISPESGSERVRRLNKGYYYSNEQLLDALKYVNELKVPVEIFFTIGLPSETADDIKETRKLQKILRGLVKRTVSIRTEVIELDPGSPLYICPQKYGVVKDSISFMDLFQLHSDSGGLKSKIGYCKKDFFEKYKHAGAHPANIFDRQLHSIKCRYFCSMSNLILDKFGRTGVILSQQAISFFCRCICSCVFFLRNTNALLRNFRNNGKGKKGFLGFWF